MPDLPTGTVTFLFTDLEGQTPLWEAHPEAMREALARHDALLRRAVLAHGGHVVKATGDGLHAAFARAPDALGAALDAQRALVTEAWPTPEPLRARIGLHSGAAEERDGDYYGRVVNRAARVMQAGHGGQVLLSQAAAGLVRGGLPVGTSLRDLGEHRLKDLQEPERLFQLLAPDLPEQFPAPKTLGTHPNNLPLQVTSFVGREREIAALAELLGSARLVTLTGAGGCGKTRLALQVAADLIDEYPDGVWFVDLASLAVPGGVAADGTDESLVAQAVQAALRLHGTPGRPPLASLVDHLRARHLLLVLDNCEHLVAACASVADALLRAGPGLTVLATSREPLGVPGEVGWRVPSLALPGPDEAPTPLDLSRYPAIRLFVERARLVAPAFALTDENALAVDRVCRRLDGLALAIELAAARVRVLTAEQIAARLDDLFGLLVGGARVAPRRQQTLRATLDWSHDLLSAAERRLFRRLAAFAGGWTLDAAEAVCAGGPIERGAVLDLLTALVDKSLAVAEPRGQEVRYRLLEPVRQYAVEKLVEAGEDSAVRDRHRDWVAAFAARELRPRYGQDLGALRNQAEAEHQNLRAALAWCLQRPDGARTGLDLAADAWSFWFDRGYYAEATRWLSALLDAVPERTRTRVRGLVALSDLLRHQGDLAPARALGSEALAIVRETGDAAGEQLALQQLGLAEASVGEYAAARAHLEQSLAIARSLDDRGALAARTRSLAVVSIAARDYGRARALLEESLAAARDGLEMGGALQRLGILDRLEGDLARSRERLEASLVAVEGRLRIAEVINRNALGNLARAEGRAAEARATFGDLLRQAHREGHPLLAADQLCSLGVLAIAQGAHAHGVRLLAAGASVSGVVGSIHTPDIRVEGEESLARARAALGPAAFAAAWAEGRAMTREQAVADALGDAG